VRRGDRRRDREGRRGRRRGPRSVVASRGGRRASRVATTTTTTTTTMEELGGVAGAPPPPTPTPRDVPLMRPGDVVLLDMNGEKWAFINLKRGGCARVRPSVRARVVPSVLRRRRRRRVVDRSSDSTPEPSAPIRPSVRRRSLSSLSSRRRRAFSRALLPLPPVPLPARPRSTACVGKHRAVSLDPLIDQPFGGAYEVDQARPHLFTLVPVRPRRRGERDSLRTLSPGVLSPLFARASLSIPTRRDRRLSTPYPTPFDSTSDAFRLHPEQT
jgi:hypothetical protein